MTYNKPKARLSFLAASLIGASAIALGMGVSAPKAAAAPFQVLPAKSVSADSPILQARYRARSRSAVRVKRARRARVGRRAVRSRYYRRRGGNAAAAAMIGAFAGIVGAAIAAENRRDRYETYYRPHRRYYPDYAYYPQTYYPQPAYYPQAYYPQAVYGGGYYVKRKRRGIARVFGRSRRVYVPAQSIGVPPTPVYGGGVYRAHRAYRPRARVFGRGGIVRRHRR